jgi:hypothetical protein
MTIETVIMMAIVMLLFLCIEIPPVERWLIHVWRIRNAQCPACEEYVIYPPWKGQLTGSGSVMPCPLCKTEITISRSHYVVLSFPLVVGIMVLMFTGWPLWVKTVVWVLLVPTEHYLFLRFCPLSVAPKRWEF